MILTWTRQMKATSTISLTNLASNLIKYCTILPRMTLTIKLRPKLFPRLFRGITEQLCAMDRQVLERLSQCLEVTLIISTEVLSQEQFNRFSMRFRRSLIKQSQSESVTCKFTTNNSWTCWLRKPSTRANNPSLTS